MQRGILLPDAAMLLLVADRMRVFPKFPLAAVQKLSVVLITLNAAHQLEPCLQSARFADEIVLVDSGSTDGTAELAQRYGARVEQREWRGFGPQKQLAVSLASHDWVLCLDADERVSEDLRASIQAALVSPAFVAWRFARCNRFMGRWLKHGEGYPDWSLRLFDRRHARWSDDAVHEKVLCDAPVGTLSGDLLHESGEQLADYLNKQNRYTSLQADALHQRGKHAHAGHLLLSPLLRFIKFFIIRRGFLDGVPGLVHTLIGCFNSFTKYAKLMAMDNEKR
jgi:glycosyltransferase involved in cell wall biosynthesis